MGRAPGFNGLGNGARRKCTHAPPIPQHPKQDCQWAAVHVRQECLHRSGRSNACPATASWSLPARILVIPPAAPLVRRWRAAFGKLLGFSDLFRWPRVVLYGAWSTYPPGRETCTEYIQPLKGAPAHRVTEPSGPVSSLCLSLSASRPPSVMSSMQTHRRIASVLPAAASFHVDEGRLGVGKPVSTPLSETLLPCYCFIAPSCLLLISGAAWKEQTT